MPWKIKKDGTKYQVIRKTDGKVKAAFEDKDKALAYLKALYANAGPEVTKKVRRK